ncbi:5'-nucleotidase [Streptomyces chartreusis]|uniref:5'-nucleotidase n=1 Tax=Streptomyces chartreusis TaxID=1969 RepID=UPI0037ACBD17
MSVAVIGASVPPPHHVLAVLSRKDPDTGLRVMLRSIESHGLAISRAMFMQGRSPYRFMPALNMSLFLSANETDVREAVALGLPAGRVLGPAAADDTDDQDLRIAFDFDGVLAGDSSELVFQAGGIEGFRSHETINAATPHDPGPLRDFLASLNRLQRREEEQRTQHPDYKIRVRVSLVTARNALAHERAVRSLKGWGVTRQDRRPRRRPDCRGRPGHRPRRRREPRTAPRRGRRLRRRAGQRPIAAQPQRD